MLFRSAGVRWAERSRPRGKERGAGPSGVRNAGLARAGGRGGEVGRAGEVVRAAGGLGLS